MGLETDRPATMQADEDEVPQQTEAQPTNVIYHQVPALWEQLYDMGGNQPTMQQPDSYEAQSPVYPPYPYPAEGQPLEQETSPMQEETEPTRRHWLRRRDRHA